MTARSACQLWPLSLALLLASLGGVPAAVFLKDNIDRPLRYFPESRDFVITNGVEFFNRPLYCLNSAFRVDGGDKPEFSLYLPGRGGNLRLGLKTFAGVKWLNDAGEIIARYRPGSLLYDIRDPLLGNGELHLAVLPLSRSKGIIVRTELQGARTPVELVWAFGGANGMKGRRNGDIGCEIKPVSEFFQLEPAQCKDDKFTIATNTFVLRSKTATISGVANAGATFTVADATHWPTLRELLVSGGENAELPVVVGTAEFHPGQPLCLVLQQIGNEQKSQNPGDLESVFAAAEERRRAIADRVIVETPDAFVNAAASALNVAADAVWDEQLQSFMHGAVAWRVRLLGWRGPYAGDELGWHERTAAHFAGYARQQNTNPIPKKLPPADADANLSRNEAALHSNGDLTKTHYDMNLVGVDAFFRHLLWTGDLDYARRMWPVIERHLAWERRLFRREFGADKLPLYEAYCCIWASDDVSYNGGGATHSSAYNFYHNTMAARVAKLIGKDPSPFEREAELIAKAMRRELWLNDRGWFGESKDLLGLQLVHPNAAAWTFYHTIDSEVPTPLEAWQMSRFVDTQIARIPLRGLGVPPGCFTMPTTSWMPYSWSVNNVVMAEVAHTSLAYWQAGRTDAAFPLFKGAVLDSMFMGLCPGNVGMCTWFDTYRRESQRDFADGVGAMSRALVEGLFGVQPDMLAGELKIRPGFPAEWNHASIQHPDLNFKFRRDGEKETFLVEQKFSKQMALRLQIPALRDDIAEVTVNGYVAKWNVIEDSVGVPQVEIRSDAAARHEVVIVWRGQTLAPAKNVAAAGLGKEFETQFVGDKLAKVTDPQQALSRLVVSESSFRGQATGTPRDHTVFALLGQGRMTWWQPVEFEIRGDATTGASCITDWKAPLPATTKFEPVHLESLFNDKVTQIFRNKYLSPRSPFCSLAMPAQGFGSWCHPQDEFNVDDSGLRAAAKEDGKIVLPNGVPLSTPAATDEKNIIFTSQWDNYPREVVVPLTGKSSHAFLLMVGSTSAMQSRLENGEIVVTYADGSTARLELRNPTTWWPIDQDYYIDDFAFARAEPLPPRVDLKTGKVRVMEMVSFEGRGRTVSGGAATVLDLPLDASKELKSLAVCSLANEVVIGLMSVTLER
jgi:hypothetical protein